MLGEVTKERVVLTENAIPGDAIVLTKGIAIEGTALLAREAYKELRKSGVSEELIEKAKRFLFSPGISVTADATITCDTVRVHSMHDPTEGGLATGLMEMAQGAGVGLIVYADQIPILPECQAFCRALSLDPLGLIGSGALLATLPPEDVPKLIEALAQAGIPACDIGRVTRPEEGLKLQSEKGVRDLPTFESDELARFFGE